MKSIITAFVTCLALFGASLATTHFLLNRDGTDPSVPAGNEEQASGAQPDGGGDSDLRKSLPVGLLPGNPVSIEAVIQMSDSIKKMEQQLIEREQQVVKKEQRLQLLFDDLNTEQEEMRAFSDGIDAKVDMLNRMTNGLQAKLDELDAKTSELEKLQKQAGQDETAKREEFDNRVNDVKGWFADLEPQQAADYLKEFANNGKLEFAASLLQKLPDRQKSKILSAMSDPLLIQQLIDALTPKP